MLIRKWNWTSCKWRFPLFAALCLAASEVSATSNTKLVHADDYATPSYHEFVLTAIVNQQTVTEPVIVLRNDKGEILVPEASIAHWRLLIPNVEPIPYQGTKYYLLSSIPGLIWNIDESLQSLNIQAPPTSFVSTVIDSRSFATPSPDRSSWGGFMNYDFFTEQGDAKARPSGFVEMGAFGPHGSGISRIAMVNTSGRTRMTRLDTTLTLDYPEQLATLRLGDTITRPGMWGRSVRYAGFQYATNFATQPYLPTIPLRGINGQAILPSTVDLFVNNALVARSSVSPGPFSIRDIPTITGSGDLQVVVRDILGREQIITQPFYSSASLLKKGLKDFSYEFGFERKNYGTHSYLYGDWLAAATYRIGLSDSFTGEVRSELSKDLAGLGTGASFLVGSYGTATLGLAASVDKVGSGLSFAAGFERRSRPISFSIRTALATDKYSQLGMTATTPIPLRLTQASIGVSMNEYGSVGLSYLYQRDRSGAKAELLSANYSLPLKSLGTLNFSFLTPLGHHGEKSFFITFTKAFGDRTSGSVSMNNSRGDMGRSESTVQIQRSLPIHSGAGYNLALRGKDDINAALHLQNNIGTYSLEIARFERQTGLRLSASGGAAFIGGSGFLTRRIGESFGLVQVGNYPGVRVYADNQLVSQTDSQGRVLLPRLRPYENNSLSIEQLDLPIDAKIDALRINAVPPYRSGIFVNFPVKQTDAAVLHIMLKTGGPLPPGATVSVEGVNDPFPVGLDGEVYVTGIKEGGKLIVEWKGQKCNLEVGTPRTDDPMPNLGTFICGGILK